MTKHTVHLFLSVLLLMFFHYSNGQKKIIDSSVYESWPKIDHFELSTNGNYVKYQVGNIPIGGFSTIIQSTKSDWNDTLVSEQCQFTNDGKSYVFKRGEDLVVKDLGKLKERFVIKQISTFELLSSNDAGDWILYRLKDSPDTLHIKNLKTSKQISYKTISYIRSNDKTYIIFPTKTESPQLQFHLLNLKNQTDKVIWNGSKIIQALFSASGKDIVFIGLDTSLNKSIWHFKEEWNFSVCLDAPIKKVIKHNFPITRLLTINSNAKRVFISLNTNEQNIPSKGLDVWSYHDVHLQSEQLITLQKKSPSVTALIDLETQKVELLEKAGFRISSSIYEAAKNNSDFILAEKYKDENINGSITENRWNSYQRPTTYLISLKDYSAHKIGDILNFSGYRYCVISPSGKFVIYFDPNKRSYFCISTSGGNKIELTKHVSGQWTSYYWKESIERSNTPEGIAGWAVDETEVYIYDQNDIFSFDPTGVRTPINLTNGFGKRNNIVFRFIEQASNKNKTAIVSGFNRCNKQDGFFRILLDKSRNPELLTLQDALFIGEPVSENYGPYKNSIIKARDSEAYIVQRMKANESPNLFFTTDFSQFKRISNITPEKYFNWLTTQLFSWTTRDGIISKGILYKPENFDSSRKYPIIFQYYQRNSEGLNAYLVPEWSKATIDIPTYVSNGYLVFVPDIHYSPGNTGKCVLDCVESAAEYLKSNYSWIDTNRMGLNGHSFGGMQTNYIVANSSLFAAAVSACGWANQISIYNSVRQLSTGTSRQRGTEGNHMNLGSTLWERPDIYMENSPILRANKVITPLLMMNNINDDDIDFNIGGIEFFTALRSLGKIVWMLQYDNETHILNGDFAIRDFTIRTQQFFDHYLKGQSAPMWMTKGISAKDKGKVLKYELDSINACSKTCKICLSKGLEPVRVLIK